MVGMMAASWREKAVNLLNSVKCSPDIPKKMERLRQLKEVLLQRDTSLLPEFAPLIAEMHIDQPSPVRRLIAETIGEVGSKRMDLLPKMVPTLISFLKDETPAVARQTITSGTYLFRNVLEKVAIQGLHSSEVDDSMESSWTWMLNFKDAVFPVAFLPGSDGVRLQAIKFVEAMILLYTPDPNGSLDPPHEDSDGTGFNVSWLRGGHPLLKAGDLSTVASQSLGQLLDQLRSSKVKSLSNSLIIVLINCLSAIAKKRPSFYGRILPVLLYLDPAHAVIEGVEVSGAFNALKNAFVAFLKCTHPGAAPWRARVVEALKSMNAGKLVDQTAFADACGSGSVTAESYTIKEEKPLLQTCSEANGVHGLKRVKVEEADDLMQDDDTPSKRARITPISSRETATESSDESADHVSDNLPLNGLMTCSGDGDDGPVQQLVGVFGALVAQGDKAADSLDILISSISADLLAEVVMANMRHLPPSCPKTEIEEEHTLSLPSVSSFAGHDRPFIPTSSFVSDILSLSGILSLLKVQRPTSHETSTLHSKDEGRIGMLVSSSDLNDTTRSAASALIPSVSANIPGIESNPVISSYTNDVLEDKIPGLGNTNLIDEVQDSMDVSHSSTAELQDGSQEHVISSGSLPLDTTSSGSMSTYISETITTRVAPLDANEAPSTSSSSIFSSSQFFLPRMTTPVIDLTDEQKDNLQKVAFARIIEAYKQIAVASDSGFLFQLLACLSVESPIELDSWSLLQKHILSDYINHEGHELTIHVLYRLFRESEQDQDFFSSTTAASDYEKFLVTVAENLRDLFPASDKSLSRLLGEVPYLPKPVLKLLECLCCPDRNEKNDKDIQSGDRVTQGLSAVWSLILLRPSNRDACLNIALQSAVHDLEEVRMKAIRLVANKLFPLSYIAQKIEDFASEMLLSVVDGLPTTEDTTTECSAQQKDADVKREQSTLTSNETSSNTDHLNSTQNALSSSISEAQRRMSLYFALCTKKHSLLQKIFAIYKNMPNSAKQAVHRHIPILVRTTGTSSELLSIISDPPEGSKDLLMQVLRTLTDGATPSQDLIISIRRLFDTKLKDVEILIPILSSLKKEEVLSIFPQIVNLSTDKFQVALSRILQGSPYSGPSLTPEEVLIAIHGVDPEKDGVALKKVMDACTSCFEQRHVFTHQVLAKVLNQLVEQIPLPLLFMRTVIQAIGAFPTLVDFVMEILSRLVNKQIWKYPKLWVGFLKCAVQTKPQSFNVLLQLPAAQLENALNRNPVLKAPVTDYANQPNIRSTLPRSTLVVLGLALDSQTSGRAQTTTQCQAAETSNSVTDVLPEVTPDSTAVS